MQPRRRPPIWLLLAAVGCRHGEGSAALRIPAECAQLLVVRTPDWEATAGWLRPLERSGPGAAWRDAAEPKPVTLGRSGLGWADGAFAGAGPRKREGDGRTPAGLFPLGVAFGADPEAEVKWIRLPYLRLSPDTECVDDPGSRAYNSIVPRGPGADWKSAERMLEVGAPYRLGIFVGHNVAPARPGLGSCIFLHLWGAAPAPTSGCTAMARESLEALLRWLDPAARPHLLQLPEEELRKVRESLGVPN